MLRRAAAVSAVLHLALILWTRSEVDRPGSCREPDFMFRFAAPFHHDIVQPPDLWPEPGAIVRGPLPEGGG